METVAVCVCGEDFVGCLGPPGAHEMIESTWHEAQQVQRCEVEDDTKLLADAVFGICNGSFFDS